MHNVSINKKTIERYRKGDQEAFRLIYENTSSLIYNAAYKIILNEEDARDIAHDTYVTAFEKRTSFKEESTIATWLYRIAVNKALNFIKRKKRTLTDNTIEGSSDMSAISENEKNEELHMLKELLERVPEDQRICVQLRDIQQLSYEEISATLKINIGTVRSRINRGRQQLASMYAEQKKQEVTAYEMR
jgi:RNA polymerase sigma-70 factor (ECF subfamily)